MPFFRKPIEHESIVDMLQKNKPLSELEYFALELTAWKASPERQEQLDGDRYYSGDHDILQRIRTAIGNDGDLVPVPNLPNNRIIDNQYAKHIDQKKNYLFGQPISFDCENKTYADKLAKVLGKKFMRALKNAGCEALNGGISWLYPYYDKNGELAFRVFSSYEIKPFWNDSAHTDLDMALRCYPVEVYIGTTKKVIEKVDVFKIDGVKTYIFDGGRLFEDPAAKGDSYVTVTDAKGKAEKFNWARIPLIPIKCNAKEIPLIRRARQLQDAINSIMSDFVNNMQEDVRNTILVLKNYDGTDLGEFRKNLMTYGTIKVRSVEGQQGGVDTLTIEVNAENYKTILSCLKKALIENMRSYDAKDDRMSNNPNQMNIQSMYADIDLDANDMETELQAAFEDILWFVNTHLANTGEGNFQNEEVNVIFNRDILINESEAIDNCAKSVGIISNETIVGMHPWIDDPTKELERLADEKVEAEAADPYRGAFENGESFTEEEPPDNKGGPVNEE